MANMAEQINDMIPEKWEYVLVGLTSHKTMKGYGEKAMTRLESETFATNLYQKVNAKKEVMEKIGSDTMLVAYRVVNNDIRRQVFCIKNQDGIKISYNRLLDLELIKVLSSA